MQGVGKPMIHGDEDEDWGNDLLGQTVLNEIF